MARLAPARKAALSVFSKRRRRDGHARDLLRNSEAIAALDPRDRALASRLVLGATAAVGTLDACIDAYVNRPSSLEPRVRDALELATFEALYLETPGSALVSQGVELVRSVSPRAAGMANAVLRKVLERERPRVREARERVADAGSAVNAEDLALVAALPLWLVERVLSARGEAAAREFCLAELEPAPVFVATNRARHDEAEACELLEAAGLAPRPTWLAGSFLLDAPAGLATSGLVDAVDVVVADLAAQEVAQRAAARAGEHVLEVGQGRGSKSVLLQNEALLSGGFAQIEAVDAVPFKVEVATRRMELAGLAEHVQSHALDARLLAGSDLPSALAGTFDLVFVDAPCSGTGTMRRHPEIAWSLAESDITGTGSLSELQLEILSAAAARVARGGRLVYATCSVLPEENEQVVEAFLEGEAGQDFELEHLAEKNPYLQTLPERAGNDGHFCACLKRC